MIILITGASHTGKTLLSYRLIERFGFPCLSLDHLKMGLIRSGMIPLSPTDDAALTACLWPIAREMIRTAMENRQNLILEGCYIPFDWQQDFSKAELEQIRFLCLVMGEDYIRSHFDAIKANANAAEQRLFPDDLTMEAAIRDNAFYRAGCSRFGLPLCEITAPYDVDGLWKKLVQTAP